VRHCCDSTVIEVEDVINHRRGGNMGRLSGWQKWFDHCIFKQTCGLRNVS